MILDFDILAWIVGTISLLIVLAILWKRGYTTPRLFFVSVFWTYILFLLKIAIFPIPVGRGSSTDTTQQLMQVMLATINDRLFFFGYYVTFKSVVIAVLQNLLLMIPFGFGINFIMAFKLRDMLWLALLMGFGIEALQFVLALLGVSMGMWRPDHIVDINDALLNVVGVLLGYGFFRFFAAWYAPIQHAVKTKEFFAYIQDVARQPE